MRGRSKSRYSSPGVIRIQPALPATTFRYGLLRGAGTGTAEGTQQHGPMRRIRDPAQPPLAMQLAQARHKGFGILVDSLDEVPLSHVELYRADNDALVSVDVVGAR
jgi:hypothetical protein